ncbi:MAG: hypothetical protein M3O28_06655, partial [Actinomycetota bacterium]|nr:hypothetical protein [Actinomycetota bacterium]
VVAGGLAGAYALTQTYYFVGRDGSQVAIFRGVNTQIGPLKFFNVYRNSTGLVVADLNPSVRSQVHDGISADNEKDAEKIVANLHGQLLPLCLAPSTLPSSTTASPTTGPTQPTASRGVRASRTTSAAKATPGTARSSVPPTPTPSATPTLPAPTQVPGVTCRPAR